MQAEEAFAQDFPDFHMQRIQGKRSRVQGRLEDMLDTRMLFSCLVDADYCVSASDDDPAYLEKNSRPPLDAEAMLKKLEVHCAHLRKTSTADVSVNALRNEVYARCGEAGEQPMGLFTLTAPTGVGENNGNDSFCAPPLCAAPITTDNCGASVSYIGRATPERI